MRKLFDYTNRFRILKGGKISLVVSALLTSVSVVNAAPTGGTVTSGSATIAQSGTTTNINQTTNKATINWQDFSIATDETVNFVQPDVNSVTLNRVVGNEKSIIDGTLNANGQVWILNSNGILFNKNSSVNTAGILATTSELNDTDFNAGNYNFKNATLNTVINQGTIEVSNSGAVILASNEVINSGTIKAVKGKVHLVAADSYSVNLNGNSLINLTVDKGVLDAMVSNSGTVIANGGEIYLTTNAVDELLKGVVNNTGIIEANSIDGLTGKVELFAHGGTAEIAGTINADEGFVETSGKYFDFQGADINAADWLIDPVDIDIDTTLANAIRDALESANVTITTDGSNTPDTSSGESGSNGDITVSASIEVDTDLGATRTLTLTADRHIIFEDGVNIDATTGSNAQALNVVLIADNATTPVGDGIIQSGGNISTNGGNLTFGVSGREHSDGYLVSGDLYLNGSSAQTFNTNGGAINVYGETLIANTNGVTFTSTNGNVSFYGVINSGNTYSGVNNGSALNWTTAAGTSGARNDANSDGDTADVGDSYLVNIGSRIENAVAAIASDYQAAWIGAYRDSTGNWMWSDGPESGTNFFDQTYSGSLGSGGSAISNAYTNWNTGEPNNSGSGEPYGQFTGTEGKWNDLPDSGNVSRYVKETNLAGSSLTINAGTGTILFDEDIGNAKALDSLTVTAAYTDVSTKAFEITTDNNQIYNSQIRLLDDMSQFTNASFEDGSTSGWTVTNSQTYMNGGNSATIGGFTTPDDNVAPNITPSGGTAPYDTYSYPGTFATTVVTDADTGSGTKSLRMTSSGGSISTGYGVIRGPYVVSNSTLDLSAGQSISFKWKASGGSDAYDVLGYLLNTSTGATQIILNETGASASASTSWATSTLQASAAGTYKFVFVSGSWDATGGRALGAQLYIDDIKAYGSTTFTGASLDFQNTVNTSGNEFKVVSPSINFDSTIEGTGTVTVDSTGQVDLPQTTAVTLKHIGTGILNAVNTSNDIDYISMGTSTSDRAGKLDFVNSAAFTIKDLYSSNTISAQSLTGDVTLYGSTINTSNTSSSALVINAAKNTAAGTSTGGNIVKSGSPSITLGTGGVGVLYTGSVTGSTTIASLISSGGFRYNSDETTTNYTSAISGLGLVYREAVSITASSAGTATIDYGDSIPHSSFTPTYVGAKNSDSSSSYGTTTPVWVASNGPIVNEDGTYTMIYSSGGLATLGYTVTAANSGNNGILTVSGVNDLTNIITPITNIKVAQEFVPKFAFKSNPIVQTRVPLAQITTGKTIKVSSTAVDKLNTKIIDMKELRRAENKIDIPKQKITETKTVVQEDIVVPISEGSIIQLVNGGLTLPNGVDQQFFISQNEDEL